MNLIRGTRSRGIEEYSVVGARVNRVRESTRATLHGAKEEKLARQGRATGWPSLNMVCLHSATMRRSSVFHGNYRRAWSSMPFVYQLISLFRSTYFFFSLHVRPCLPSFSPRNKDDRGINYPGEVSRNDEKKERFIVFIHRRVSRRITIIILYNKYSLLIFTRNELDKKCSKRDITKKN